jgi:hypothetical protein
MNTPGRALILLLILVAQWPASWGWSASPSHPPAPLRRSGAEMYPFALRYKLQALRAIALCEELPASPPLAGPPAGPDAPRSPGRSPCAWPAGTTLLYVLMSLQR